MNGWFGVVGGSFGRFKQVYKYYALASTKPGKSSGTKRGNNPPKVKPRK